jgi:glutamate/tyrosine decarboxylase-like PLP-dependent enzyme
LALASAHEGYVQDGVRAFSGQPVFYISRESHLAWIKIAQQTGLGRAGAQMIATDGTGRMDTADLASTIECDRASGRVPVMVVATAGTTSAGMIDPLGTSAALAQRHGLWFHVDAAWAGALIASNHLRGALAGIELADSITIDAHKWFAATMGCGVLLTRHATAPSMAFQVAANYMPSQSASVDPYMTSLQWSRRFLGLRLFLALAAAGWDGYGSHVERAVQLMALLRRTMIAKGWSVVNDSPAAVVCLLPPAGSAQVRSIVERVVASGKAWISIAKLEGSEIIRVCATHGETTVEDIHQLANALYRAAQGPVTPRQCNASYTSTT